MKLRDLTPLGWAASAAAAILAIVLLTTAWGRLWSWLPWTAEARLPAAEQAAATAQSEATALGLQSEGQANIAGRVDTYTHATLTIQNATSETIAQGRTAPDAQDPVPADRFARQRALDGVLCDTTPSICSSAPAGAPE